MVSIFFSKLVRLTGDVPRPCICSITAAELSEATVEGGYLVCAGSTPYRSLDMSQQHRANAILRQDLHNHLNNRQCLSLRVSHKNATYPFSIYSSSRLTFPLRYTSAFERRSRNALVSTFSNSPRRHNGRTF